MEVSEVHGTVDLLPPGNPSRGARMRALHNETGTELLFTLIFPVGTTTDAIARQMTTVEDELRTVRDLCQAQTSSTAASDAH